MTRILGVDVGGVNTKAALIEDDAVRAVRNRSFELQRDPTSLSRLLAELGGEVGAAPGPGLHCALTMTAELSQMFRTKREGVRFVLDAVEGAFPASPIGVFAVDGRFLTPGDARAEPLAVAAANWAATARAVAERHADALLVDIGTTTTDIIPIVGGAVVAEGWTDPDRLASRELVYTGAVRTPVEAIVRDVPLPGRVAAPAGRGRRAGVSAEGFALVGDVHVWRGDLDPADYTVPAPDGRPATREFAGERLARVVCADREMLDEAGVSAIADAVAEGQVALVAEAMRTVRGRHPSLSTAVVTGLGAFIAERAAAREGLDVVRLAAEWGAGAARCAPAAAVGLLYGRARGRV